MHLILASTSCYRRELVARLGVPFTCHAPDCDEDSFKHLALAPEALAQRLAKEKAGSVSQRFPKAAVIGSDQLLEVDGMVLGKPGSAERAVEQLLLLSHKTHRLITAMVLQVGPKVFEHTDITELTFRPLTKLQAERYVATDNPVDCAGSYKFEAAGIRLVQSMISEDPSAITGLPLLRLGDWLTLLGFTFP